jgi:PIN domain nuclease of toxin-antitoxin system
LRRGGANKPVFDASAVLALIQGEPGAAQMGDLQSDAVEVVAKLVIVGTPAAEARTAFAALGLSLLSSELSPIAVLARNSEVSFRL